MNEFNNLVQQTEQLIISNYSQNQNYGNPANTMRNPNSTASLFGSNDIPPIQSSSSFGSSSYPLSRGSSFSSSSDSLYPLSRVHHLRWTLLHILYLEVHLLQIL